VDLAPLPDRIGRVGGIESLSLDGRRYYFGFDYKSDVVLSPLIDDPGAMAAFASEYMRQTTGKRFHVAAAAEHAPGNWGMLFGPLAEGVAQQGLG